MAKFKTKDGVGIIPKGTKVIEDGAFAHRSSLKSVIIPDSVTVIKARAFEGCTSLENVIIPKSVTKIGLDSFSGCISLESVTLLSRAELYNGLFANCPSLQTINVPSDYVDYYKEYLPEELHDKIVELDR